MAEYIDRDGLIKFLDNLQQPKIPITKGFTYITIDDAIRVVSERPTADAIPIPEGATNGDMIKAMFPDVIISESEETLHLKYHTVNSDPLFFVQVSKRWWNAPYRKVEE